MTETEFCCEKMTMHIRSPPDGGFGRRTAIVIDKEGKYWTDFSDGEYGDIELFYCPFCGKKLETYDLGPVHESGSHEGTHHYCENFDGIQVWFDNGRFTECPFGCGFLVNKKK